MSAIGTSTAHLAHIIEPLHSHVVGQAIAEAFEEAEKGAPGLVPQRPNEAVELRVMLKRDKQSGQIITALVTGT